MRTNLLKSIRHAFGEIRDIVSEAQRMRREAHRRHRFIEE